MQNTEKQNELKKYRNYKLTICNIKNRYDLQHFFCHLELDTKKRATHMRVIMIWKVWICKNNFSTL